MAPAACDTICRHLMDFERQPSEYDRIITGDLGKVVKGDPAGIAEAAGVRH